MFWILGIIGAVLLLAGLLLDDVLEGIVPDSDYLSIPALGGALAAFGFGTAIIDSQTSASLLIALGVGGVLALATAFGAVKASQAAMSMPTDPTPRASDLVGLTGRVVTPISPGRSGEVLLVIAGHPTKVSAVLAPLDPPSLTASDEAESAPAEPVDPAGSLRSESDLADRSATTDLRSLPAGSEIVVVYVLSPTRVMVQDASTFWTDR